ncbi:MAG: hypothetical protein HQK50_06210 [Oligoflexia bacterium]|nr:hypothetical protein [Oligoflexia bacterium]
MFKLISAYCMLTLSLILSYPLTAAAEQLSQEELKLQKLAQERPSEYNRYFNRHMFTAGIVTADAQDGVSFDYGHSLDANTHLGIRVESLSANRESEISARKMFGVGPTLKFFVGNSFYLKAAVLYQKKQYKQYTFGPLMEVNYQDAENDYLVVDAKIGNQWQFRHFTIGCDWIGIAQRSVCLSNCEHQGSIDSRQYYLSALNFYLGVAF